MKVFQAIGDFFLDKQNNGDEKRFMGIVFLGFSLYYAVFRPNPNPEILIILVSVGTTLLGVAALTDKIGMEVTSLKGTGVTDTYVAPPTVGSVGQTGV